jgi:uncharacterized membrane protein YgcG
MTNEMQQAPVLWHREVAEQRLLTSCIAILFVVFFSFSSPAAARNWHIADFNDVISVGGDGSALVVERISVVFDGEFQGILRTIPVTYPGPSQTSYRLFFSIQSVTDGDGHKLKYEVHDANGNRDLKIFVPGAVDATRTVEIAYLVRNGIRYFEDHHEFYWNVTGNDWPVPIDHVTATVTMPPAAAGSLRAQAFTGVYGSTEGEATTRVKGAEISFETTNPLPMRGGMTVDIYVPKGILREPSGFTRFFWFVGGNPVVFLPLVVFGVMFGLWWYKGRDPDPGLSVAPMYEPPKGISPAEAGTLLDDTIHPRDITSTLVDLAVRGYVKIEETAEKGLVFSHKDYTFHLLIAKSAWRDLQAHESVMLSNIFIGEEVTRLSALRNRFYSALPAIRADIKSQLRSKGMYLLDPDSANGYSLVAAIAVGVIVGGLQFLGWADFFSSFPLFVFCALIAAAVWWLFARVMTAKTVKGGQTRVAVLGFQEFMNRVDAERLKRMPPDTFEKYLPYAMALGVEHQWAQAFAGIAQNAPSWYVGSGGSMGFNPIFFSSSMHGMASEMNQVFVSAPRASSSGSGFSGGGGGGGGGFSGGGFGGGGGGAF